MNSTSCSKHNLYNCSYCHTTKDIKKTCVLHGLVQCQQCRPPSLKERVSIIINVIMTMFHLDPYHKRMRESADKIEN